MSCAIVVSPVPTEEDLAAITKPLLEFNLQAGPPPGFRQIALLIRDEEGRSVGGLWGRVAYEWLHVEYLVVPQELRGEGLGRELMQRAEQMALESGCIGVWLDTLAFQARGFYEKLGYACFGQIDDKPIGGAHYFLKKRLDGR